MNGRIDGRQRWSELFFAQLDARRTGTLQGATASGTCDGDVRPEPHRFMRLAGSERSLVEKKRSPRTA
ncbi:Hypothetical protein CAP_3322 [Chondromyces apiculatus DSM 436]|uniref:Uncharacterized protein n=1 Tax=Chondromyces apiculatus DSM 436 TaxID=1192034 RepID=A0A017T9B1_9BACT|nr:Hypothetical protein CAP_3322 [Chondromyces apiculatus DSM 436]